MSNAAMVVGNPPQYACNENPTAEKDAEMSQYHPNGSEASSSSKSHRTCAYQAA